MLGSLPRFAVVASLALGVLAAVSHAEPVLLTAPQTISPGQTTITSTGGGSPVPLIDAEITVRGTTLTVNGRHTIRSLTVERNAGNVAGLVTHAQTTTFDYSGDGTDVVQGAWLNVIEHVFIQGPSESLVRSSIGVDFRGHPSATGPGAGLTSGRASGAGHGGAGWDGSGGLLGGDCYGSLLQPTEFGSGGGRDNDGNTSNGGRGGGALRLIVGGTLTVNGTISANGENRPAHDAGGGSGGSLWIQCGTLAGAGQITARGGDGNPGYSGAGGGGRIGIFSCDVFMSPANITALGGVGWQNGQAGSVYYGSSSVVIFLQPDSTTYTGGDEVSLVVDAIGDGEVTYQWRREGIPIVNGGRFFGAQTSQLVISPIDCADGGTYDCIVTDSCGAFPTNPAEITVLAPSDYDGSGFVDTDDFTAFVIDFELGDDKADFDKTGFVDTDDFTAFVLAFMGGC